MSQVTAPPPPADLDGEAGRPASPPRRRHRARRGTITRDVIEVLLLAVALYVIITFALQTVRVDGTSMVPTLENGDLLFADKVTYHLHAPNRGDIIILQPPTDPTKDFIKRVVGMPGETIEIQHDYAGPQGNQQPHAAILIWPVGSDPNKDRGQVLGEPYLPDQTRDPWVEQADCCGGDGRSTPTPQKLRIPQDEYFVMGDNRNASQDSRSIGLIPRDHILGRAWVRIWPLNHLGFLGSGPSLSAGLALPLPLGRLLGRRRRRAVRGAAPL